MGRLPARPPADPANLDPAKLYSFLSGATATTGSKVTTNHEKPKSLDSTKKTPVGTGEGDVGKVIKDGFSMPQEDYNLISKMQIRAMSNMKNLKKSEVIRAGLRALDKISDEEFMTMIGELRTIRPGRKMTKE